MKKSHYPKNAIVYLGKMTWNDAIYKAHELGLRIPDYNTMKRLRLYDELNIFSHSITSTTYAFDTSKFVFPVSEDETIERVQLPDNAKNTRAKGVERKAFAIGEDVPNLHPHECVMFDHSKE